MAPSSPLQWPHFSTCDCVKLSRGSWCRCWSFPGICWLSLRPHLAGRPKVVSCSTTTTSTRRTACGSTPPLSPFVRRKWHQRLLKLEWRWNMGPMATGRCWTWIQMDLTPIWWTSESELQKYIPMSDEINLQFTDVTWFHVSSRFQVSIDEVVSVVVLQTFLSCLYSTWQNMFNVM